MLFYHKMGPILDKSHIQFRRPDGKLYGEELAELEGFSSILYHHFLLPHRTKMEDVASWFEGNRE